MINTKVQPFSATAFHNGEFVEVTEQDIQGQWSVFFFYPADFTFVCPTELGDVADHYDELQERGVQVYSVSTDTHFTHKAWHESSDTIAKIQYPMIGDPTGRLTRAFDVMRENEGLADRATFVVDPDGVIQPWKSPPRASVGMPTTLSAKSKPRNTFAIIPVRFALQRGKKAKKPWHPA